MVKSYQNTAQVSPSEGRSERRRAIKQAIKIRVKAIGSDCVFDAVSFMISDVGT